MPHANDRNRHLDLWWADTRQAIAFLTRIPVSASSSSGRSLNDALRAVPLAGLLIGLLVGLVFSLSQWLGLSPLISATLAVGFSLALTGCFHEDGLADTADSIGGYTREKRLAIMVDSRIGTFGASALFIALALRIGAIVQIADRGGWAAVILLLAAAGAWSRSLGIALVGSLPLARPDGIAAGVGRPTRSTVRQALLVGGISAAMLCASSSGVFATILALLVSAIALLLVRRFARAHIGGQTGDVAGAAQQICEIAFLLAIAALLPTSLG